LDSKSGVLTQRGVLHDIVRHVTPEAKVADKREAILEATIKVLQQRGLSGLKVEEVAREAEVGKGTVYLYFQDKQDLLKALVEHHALSFYRDVERVVVQNRPFTERLQEVLALRLEFASEWRGSWASVAREAHPGDPSGWLKGLRETYLRLLEVLVRSGQERGEVRRDLDPSLTAAVLDAINPQYELPRQAYLEHFMEVLVKGVGQ
jgi:AcrR family transcriptional regulator